MNYHQLIPEKKPLLATARTLRSRSFFRFRTIFSPFCLIVLIVLFILFNNSSIDLYGDHPEYTLAEIPSRGSLYGLPFDKF